MAARCLVLLAVALGACAATSAANPGANASANLSERETSGNGLVGVRYPKGFLKATTADRIFLFGPKGGSLSLFVEDRPASEDLSELARTPACHDSPLGTVTEVT